jgi:hypothetical protein
MADENAQAAPEAPAPDSGLVGPDGSPVRRLTPADVLTEFVHRFGAQNNTQRQDRQTILALISIVEGIMMRLLKQEGIEPKKQPAADDTQAAP